MPHVDGSRPEVTPRADGDQPAVPVAHQLPGVVAQHQPVAPGEQLGLQAHPGRVGRVHRPHRPVGLLEEAEPGTGPGQEHPPVADVRRAVGVLHQVRVAQPGHPEQPGLHPGQPHAGAAPRVAVRAQHVRPPQVHPRRHPVPLGEQRAPAVTGVGQHGGLVLVEREGQPERRPEVDRAAAHEAGPPVAAYRDRQSAVARRPGGQHVLVVGGGQAQLDPRRPACPGAQRDPDVRLHGREGSHGAGPGQHQPVGGGRIRLVLHEPGRHHGDRTEPVRRTEPHGRYLHSGAAPGTSGAR